jgi:outer membrane lipoprotein SlyB
LYSKIVFNPKQVNSSLSGLSQSISRLISVESGISGVKSNIDPRIINRRGIGGRLSRATASIDRIEQKMVQLKTYTANSINQYSVAEKRVNGQAEEVKEAFALALEKMLNDRYASGLYDKYHSIAGHLEHILHGAQYSAGAGLMHLLGFRFTDVDDVLKRFQVAEYIKAGKFNIPLASTIQRIENSRPLNFMARIMVNPLYLVYNRKKPLAELLYKKMTSYYPKDMVNLSNSVSTLLKDAKVTTMMDAVKSNAGSVLKSGWKLARANAVLATVITAGVETVGAGVKITENYSLYSGEKLKEENAKVVGRAVVKTTTVTVGSVGGAVVGGIIGSIGGPVGTAIGATVGGYLGSMLGDKVASMTSAWTDKQSVRFKDTIHKGTEAVASGVRNVKESFVNAKEAISDVKSHAANLLDSSKSFFGKLSFGN